MNLDEYQRFGRARYEMLADIVRQLLSRAIAAEPVYRLQQIQHRAKAIESVKRRLEEVDQLASDTIELHRKDLAGCRIVFYTNNDVNRFVNSGLLRELFDVDWDRSKFHQPRPGDNTVAGLFQSYNYVLKLKPNRTELLEYQEFEGLYCEVQVQTSLNHAWAEMAHDTIYKQPRMQGFGAREFKIIESRLEDAMRKHLLPAGYLFQRIATDAQRLADGKSLFDAGALNAVVGAADNNARYEAVASLRNDVLPHYDDIEGIFPEVREQLKEAWRLADLTETLPHETPFGSYPGMEPHQITGEIAEIFELYRYLDPDETYALTCDLYRGTSSAKAREQLVKLAERLAAHTMQIWQRHGPVVQVRLADALANEKDILPIAPVVMAIAKQILKPEITGTTSSSNSITFHSGVIAYSEGLQRARRTVIDVVGRYAENVVADDDALADAVSALFASGQRSRNRGERGESLEVVAMIFSDLAHVADRLLEFASRSSLESRQDIESRLLQFWRWNKSLPEHLTGSDKVVEAHRSLLEKMVALRDALNSDDEFVVFKVIVGYKSVFPHMWDDEPDFRRDECIRHESQDELANRITVDNWTLWKARLVNAAKARSRDLATFPPYARFLAAIAARQPSLALDLLSDRAAMPDWTIRPLADALLAGDRRRDAEATLNSWLDEGQFVQEIAALTAFSRNAGTTLASKATERSVGRGDVSGCTNLVEGAIRRFGDDPTFWRDKVFFPCLAILRKAESYAWIERSWHQSGQDSLFSNLSDEQSEIVLDAMISANEVDYQAEQILKSIATDRHQIILDWFGRRIEHATREPSIQYSPIPFSFQIVHEALQPYPSSVFASMRRWRDRVDGNGVWHASHFLSHLYPNLEEPLLRALATMIEKADTDDLAFITSSLHGFEGRAELVPVLRAILASDAANEAIEEEVAQIFNETGVMTGEFGAADAHRAKMEVLRPWLGDENQRVSRFAARETRNLEWHVASETRRAQEEIAMRKLQYGEPIDTDGSNGGNGPTETG